MVGDIFENFEPPSKKFLATPLMVISIISDINVGIYKKDFTDVHI